jgi:hypothetical protein
MGAAAPPPSLPLPPASHWLVHPSTHPLTHPPPPCAAAGGEDFASIHAAQVVEAGEKWICTRWLKELD